MHSSLPEQLHNFGWSGSSLLKRIFSGAEDSALKHANAVITICPALADFATSRITDQEKHFLIENSIYEPVRVVGGSPVDADENSVDELFEKLKSGGAGPTLLYAGTLETYQGIDLLLESMVHVKAADASIRLIVVGGSPAASRTLREDGGRPRYRRRLHVYRPRSADRRQGLHRESRRADLPTYARHEHAAQGLRAACCRRRNLEKPLEATSCGSYGGISMRRREYPRSWSSPCRRRTR